LRIVEQRPALALLDDLAVAQHDGPVAHHANDIEVTADKENSEAILAPQPRAVASSAAGGSSAPAGGAGCDGAGDADTSLLTVGKLMREAPQQFERQSNSPRTLLHTLPQSIA